MKTVGYSKHVAGYVLVRGLLLPDMSLAASAAKQDICESVAKSFYQRRSVEVALASILGSVSEIEAASEQEQLKRRLEKEKAHCLKVVRSASAYAEPSGSL